MKSLVHEALQRSLFFVFASLVFLFFLTGESWGQTGGQGAIQGTVTDPSGAMISNATVSAQNLSTHVTTARRTSSDGLYQISPLLPGNYTVTIEAQGFQTFGQDYEVNQPTMDITIKLKRPGGQYSVYDDKNQQAPPQDPNKQDQKKDPDQK